MAQGNRQLEQGSADTGSTTREKIADAALSAALTPRLQRLPSALEPELRKIVDGTVARVADVKLDAIREARDLTTRSEPAALDVAFDRSLQAMNSLEALPAKLREMTAALRVDLQDAMERLQPSPEPEPELQGATPIPRIEPSPALGEMFRERIIDMRRSGRSRDEAEQALLRFKSGPDFIGLLDEVYSVEPGPRKKGIFSRRRGST